jgi:hypothetical protein
LVWDTDRTNTLPQRRLQFLTASIHTPAFIRSLFINREFITHPNRIMA